MVLSASVSGERANDPMLFLRFWARERGLQIGRSRGNVWFAMVRWGSVMDGEVSGKYVRFYF